MQVAQSPTPAYIFYHDEFAMTLMHGKWRFSMQSLSKYSDNDNSGAAPLPASLAFVSSYHPFSC